jgi:hypothetical protein
MWLSRRQICRLGVLATLSLAISLQLAGCPAPGDRPPRADAGPNQTAVPGAVVVLNGLASNDPDGDALTYAWTQLFEPLVAINNADQAVANFIAPLTPVVLAFRLTINDGRGNSASATTAVSVGGTVGSPTLTAGPDQTVTEGTAVTISGLGIDPSGFPLTYTWVQVAGPGVALENANTPTVTFTAPPAAAVLIFNLTVDNGHGGVASVSTAVTVVPPGGTSTGRLSPIADAGLDQIVLGGTTVALSGSGSDPNGFPLQYSWTQIGGTGVLLTGANSPVATFIAPQISGVLSFRLTVNNGHGGSASSVVSITVTLPIGT